MADPTLSGPFSFQYPAPGMSNVLEYQASGLPFVTQSTATTSSVGRVHFPFVTKFFTVKNNGGGTLNIGFTAAGVAGSNKFSVPASASYTGEIRVTDLFLLGSGGNVTFEIIAGLTQIPDKNFLVLTGSHVGFSASSDAIREAAFNRGFGYSGLG